MIMPVLLQGTPAQPSHVDIARQYARQAVTLASVLGDPHLHAAALVDLGLVHKLEALSAMREQRESAAAAATATATDQDSRPATASGMPPAAPSDPHTFTQLMSAAWLPWPDCILYKSDKNDKDDASDANHSSSEKGDKRDSSSTDSSAPPAVKVSGGSACPSVDSQTAKEMTDSPVRQPQPAGCDGTAQSAGHTAPLGSGAAKSPSQASTTAAEVCTAPPTNLAVRGIPELPPAARLPHQQALSCLQEALHEALHAQQLDTAETAARELMVCYGVLQPDKAALYLAVAQSCSTARAMRAVFEGAAAGQHAEVLLERQQQQMHQEVGQAAVHLQQVPAGCGVPSACLHVKTCA